MIKRVYIELNGSWWSFSPSNWLDLVTTTLLDWEKTPGFSLHRGHRMRRPPRRVRSYLYGSGTGYYSTHPSIRVIQPACWRRGDFDDEQTEMQQLILHLKRQED